MLNIINKKINKKYDFLRLKEKLNIYIYEKKSNEYKIYRAIIIISLLLKLSYMIELFETQGKENLNYYFYKIKSTYKKSKVINELINNNKLNNIFKFIDKNSNELFHPKYKKIIEIILFQLKNKKSKIIIFTNYRITTEIIQQELKKKGISVSKFIGQNKTINKGFTQKEQNEILNKFREGAINVLVSTSIAEEGLDVPNVDLVIFFDPILSEIRNIQRRGRTGRSNIGYVIILITKDTIDEKNYWISYYNEKKMSETI